MKFVLVMVNVAVFSTVIWFAISIFLSMRRMKRLQDALVQSLNVSQSSGWFRIALTRPHHFRKLLKLIGYEARGVLLRQDDQIRIVATLRSGEAIDRCYSPESLQLRWVGNTGLGSANMHWIAVGNAQHELMISADTGLNAVPSRQATADICRTIAPDVTLPANAQADFALEKHPMSLAVVIAFFVLVAFAVVDGVIFNPYELIGLNNIAWAGPAGALLAIPLYALMAKRGVPSRESLALAMLLGLSIAGATLPALKRIDQALADGVRQYEYAFKGNALLEPVKSGPPTLRFRSVSRYWEQFEINSIHSFELIHGPLGLWQLDRRKLNEATREFYRAQDSGRRSVHD